MDTKSKVLVSVVVLIGVFAAGRYSARQPDVKSAETINQETEKQADTNKKRTTTIITEPNGRKVKTIVEETNRTTNTNTRTQASETSSKVSKGSTINVSALAGFDSTNSFKPLYGVSVSKEVLGPITVGVFGLSNGIIGVSAGFNF